MTGPVEPVADTEAVEACVCGHHETSHNPPWWSCDEPDCHCEWLRLADSTDLRQRVLTMIARALCDQEETAEREGNESWWGWSTDDIAAFTADAAITALRPVVSSSTREDGGGLTLPPNPFGTSATWADYNWRGIAEDLRRRLDGQSAASVAIDLIADAVERSL